MLNNFYSCHCGELLVGSHIILHSGPPAQRWVFLVHSVTLTLLRGGAIRALKSGGVANTATPEIKAGRVRTFSSLTQVQETDRGLSQTVTESPTCSAVSLTAPILTCA